MRAATIGIVSTGVALALALGLDQGFDTTSLTILGFIVLTGTLAIAATRRSDRGIAPARCRECDGVISPNAPYCKHCNTPAPLAF